MRIVSVRHRRERVDLTRPYAIATVEAVTRPLEAVDLFFVRVETDRGPACRGPACRGPAGVGSASPSRSVTGESTDACAEALAGLDWLVGEDPRRLGTLLDRTARRLAGRPAAQAAVDMALHDLFARALDVPLVDVLGRRREALETSVTVGIGPVEETLEEARELLGRGFRCLKVKIGGSFDEDVERLRKLREAAGAGVTIRVDANQGYGVGETRRFEALLVELDLELLEQPLPAAARSELAALPASLRRRVAADESLHRAADGLELARDRACGIWNVKLMKCGGVREALRIATLAGPAGVELMWGCMDESRLSIAAALHAAYACPATRYLDLDGSFDLARDPASGGFVLEAGRLYLTDEPGLGVDLGGGW